MKIFFDTEFTGLHKNTTLISIGLVDENDNRFYAEFTDYDKSQLNDWLNDCVISNLRLNDMEENTIRFTDNMTVKLVKGTKEFIAQELDFWHQYIYPDYDNIKLEMWSDCLAFDWVLFCDMFGHAFKVPKNIYYIPFDICTFFKLKGVDPDINREQFAEYDGTKHFALHDAIVIKKCYENLSKNPACESM